MPSPGLSLVGFLQDQQQALQHLRVTCVPEPDTKTDADLIADWQAAQAKIGAPMPSAGLPQLTPLPLSHARISTIHTQMLQSAWSGHYAAILGAGASYQMVEIAPLLAYQLSVDSDRSGTHCGALSSPPTDDELFACCLRTTAPNDNIHSSRQGQSIIIKSRSLNLVTFAEGPLQAAMPTVGVQFWWGLPLVHVVRFGGRCYLHNGYHRACGLLNAGATHMPCIFRDVATAEEAGIRTDGGTFSLATLSSANPPTVGHFTNERALAVRLRRAIRVIQISWSQHAMFDEPD
jgi:hypothetical protein